MSKIIDWIKKYYRVDYLAHLLATISLGELFFTVVHIFNGNLIHYITAALVVLFIIFAKDVIWDKWMKKGTFEWADIIIGCLGLLMVIIQWLLLLI